MKLIKEHTFFIVVFISCALLRLIPLFHYQFTYDEISGLERTQFDSFNELINKGIKIDAHPALIQIFLFYTVKFFGFKTWLIKLPFVLCSLASVYYGYLIGLKHFSKTVGQLMASFLAFSLIFIFHAPVARMYSCGVFFSLATFYYFFELVIQNNYSFKNYLLIGSFVFLSAINHHMNALFAATVMLCGLFLIEKNQLKNYIVLIVVVLITYIPNLSITLYQIGLAGIGPEQQGWLDKPYWDAFYTFLKVLFGTGKMFYVVLVLLIVSQANKQKFIFSKIQWLLLVIFLMNYLIIYSYSILRAPILQNTVLLFSGTSILLLTCTMLDSVKQYISQFVLIGITTLLIYQSYFAKDYLHQAVKQNYEFEFERTVFYKNQFGNKDVLSFFMDADPIMKTIYFKKYPHFDCVISADSIAKSIKQFAKCISESKARILIVGAGTPLYHAIAREYYPYILESVSKQNIYYHVYAKYQSHHNNNISLDEVISSSTILKKGSFSYLNENNATINDGKVQLTIDSINDFPFGTKAKYDDVLKEEGQMLLVKSSYKINNANTDIQTCISITDQKDNTNLGYTASSSRQFSMRQDSTVTIYTEYFAGSKHRELKEKSLLNCYVWNLNHSKAQLIDFEINCVNYWPQKWNYWE